MLQDGDWLTPRRNHETAQLWVCKQHDWAQVLAVLRARGYAARVLGRPYYGRLFFEVIPVPVPPTSR